MKFKIIKIIIFSFIFLNINIFAMDSGKAVLLEDVKLGIASDHPATQVKAVNGLQKLILTRNKEAYPLAKDVAIKFVNSPDLKIQASLQQLISYGFKGLINESLKKNEQQEPVDPNIIAATFALIKSNFEIEVYGRKEKNIRSKALDFCRAMFLSGQAIVEAEALAKSLAAAKNLEENKLGLELLEMLVRYPGSAYEAAKEAIIALIDNEQLSDELKKAIDAFVERAGYYGDGEAYAILRKDILPKFDGKKDYEENIKECKELLAAYEPIIFWKEYAQKYFPLDKNKTWQDEAYNFKAWVYEVNMQQNFILT